VQRCTGLLPENPAEMAGRCAQPSRQAAHRQLNTEVAAQRGLRAHGQVVVRLLGGTRRGANRSRLATAAPEHGREERQHPLLAIQRFHRSVANVLEQDPLASVQVQVDRDERGFAPSGETWLRTAGAGLSR
jgi:hypothetical protein